MTEQMNIAQSTMYLAGLVKERQGKIMTIKYFTKDGKVRTLNGRLAVKKYLSGKGAKYNALERGLVCIAEMKIMRENKKNNTNKTPYRSVNMSQVISMSSQNRKIEVVK